MLEMSPKTNLLEQKSYKYSLQDVETPNLQRDIYSYGTVPKVSFNHRRVPMNMPEEIWITDTSLRDGQQSVAPYTVDQIARIYSLLSKLGGPYGIIRQTEFFIYSKKDRQALEKCREMNLKFPEITTWIRASKEDFHLVRELGIAVPEGKAAAWRDFAAHLSELPTGTASVGGVSRRVLSGVERSDGKAELALCANAVNLESVIPCEAFAFDVTDAYRALATNTVEAMLAAAGDSIWLSGFNQTPKLYAMAIRMGYPCRPIIEAFRKHEIRGRGQRNFHLRDNVHGVEKIGAMEFVNSMLLQSDNGFVKVFPNWTGADAKFERLRAKGAFVVSSEMKGGKVTVVEVTAEKGGRFRLVDPFGGRVTPPDVTRGRTRNSNEPTLEIDLKPGETRRWRL